MKKILFVCYQNIKPGGVTRVLTNLANELVNRNYDVTILFLMKTDNTFYPIDEKIKIETLDTFSHWGFQNINPLLDKLLKRRPIKTNLKKYIYDFGQWSILIKWLKKNHQHYDLIISCWYKLSSQIAFNTTLAKKTMAWEHSNFEVGGKLWDNLLRPNYKNLKGIVSINKASLDYYKKLNSNATNIPNIVGDLYENIQNINYESKNDQLVFVGRTDYDKNAIGILKAITKVNLKNYQFKIIGDGPNLAELKDFVTRNNLSGKVTFTGSLSPDQIKEELLKSKIFLFMSKTECLPTVLLEAMFCGNALISYNCNYGPADIVNEKNGFLIPNNNEALFIENLQNLIDNDSQLLELNKSAAQESRHWKKERLIQSWISFLD